MSGTTNGEVITLSQRVRSYRDDEKTAHLVEDTAVYQVLTHQALFQ